MPEPSNNVSDFYSSTFAELKRIKRRQYKKIHSPLTREYDYAMTKEILTYNFSFGGYSVANSKLVTAVMITPASTRAHGTNSRNIPLPTWLKVTTLPKWRMRPEGLTIEKQQLTQQCSSRHLKEIPIVGQNRCGQFPHPTNRKVFEAEHYPRGLESPTECNDASP